MCVLEGRAQEIANHYGPAFGVTILVTKYVTSHPLRQHLVNVNRSPTAPCRCQVREQEKKAPGHVRSSSRP